MLPLSHRYFRCFLLLVVLTLLFLAIYIIRKGIDDWIDDKVTERLAQHQSQLSINIEDLQAEIRKQLVQPMNSRLDEMDRKISTNAKPFAAVPKLNIDQQKRILVTGGAGFVGSHLVDYLMLQGHEVTVIDNFFTGRKQNINQWIGHPNFELINHDIIMPIFIEVDEIYHLASPASPPHYMYNPIKTVKCNTIGTINMLGLASRVRAKLLFASTSEVYGDPEEHPQKESYWGNVNTVGPRSCYDEGKRAGETLCYAYHQLNHVQVRIARIFNTFGPRMHINDGRVVSNFIVQALKGKPLTVYGNGSVTRSFQYVSDLVLGLVRLMDSNVTTPVNLGNPQEYSILEMAQMIKKLTDSKSNLSFLKTVEDDPQKRKPDINKAKTKIKWSPTIDVDEGLKDTIKYFQSELFMQNLTWIPYADSDST